MRPKKRDAIRAVRPGERANEARLVVDIAGDDLGAERGEGLGLVGLRIAHDGARGEAAGGVVEDGADESAALGAGGAENCDDFFAHGEWG